LFYFLHLAQVSSECICIIRLGNVRARRTRWEHVLIVYPDTSANLPRPYIYRFMGFPYALFIPSSYIVNLYTLAASSLLSKHSPHGLLSIDLCEGDSMRVWSIPLGTLYTFAFLYGHYAINNLTHNFYVGAFVKLPMPQVARGLSWVSCMRKIVWLQNLPCMAYAVFF